MTERKLEDGEKASKMEKIILLCSEITFSSNNLDRITRDIHVMVTALKDKGEEALAAPFPERIIENDKVMVEVLDKLFEVRELIADYLNAIDAVTTLDISFGNVVFNAYNDITEEES